jgi:hypothetical protein
MLLLPSTNSSAARRPPSNRTVQRIDSSTYVDVRRRSLKRKPQSLHSYSYIRTGSKCWSHFFSQRLGAPVATEQDPNARSTLGGGTTREERLFHAATAGRDRSAERYPTRPTPVPTIGYGAAVALTFELFAVSALLEASDSAGLNVDWTNDRTPGTGAVFLYAK